MSCTVPVVVHYHTNCDAQYPGGKQKTSGRFGVHPTAEVHCVKLTVIAVQYVSVVVQEDNIMAMRQTVRQQPLQAATYSAVFLWRKEILVLDVHHTAFCTSEDFS